MILDVPGGRVQHLPDALQVGPAIGGPGQSLSGGRYRCCDENRRRNHAREPVSHLANLLSANEKPKSFRLDADVPPVHWSARLVRRCRRRSRGLLRILRTDGVTAGLTSGYSISQRRAEQNQNRSFSANWS